MTQDCLNEHIRQIQCDFAQLSSGLSDALAIGSKKIMCLNRKNVSTAHLLNLLRCYRAFEGDLTFASKIEINRLAPGSAQLTLILNFHVRLFTSSGTDEEIAIHFENEINGITLSPLYKVVRVKNILYIYSYDAAASFNDTLSITATDSSLVTSKTTNLQNNTEEILSMWNNITQEELCKVVKFAGIQAGYDKPAEASGCNC
jgi:hypothetical protein